MICPKHTQTPSLAEKLVRDALRQAAQHVLTVELVDGPAEKKQWAKLIRKHHYLKEPRLVGESLCYVAQQNGHWVALLGWSSAAFHVQARDRWIRWTVQQRHAARHLLACNARFVLLPAADRSAQQASQILSLNLQRLSADWQGRYGHPILLAETYVDPQRFEGTCYRAANWIEIGVTQGFGRSHLDFYQLHRHPKALFLYPLDPQAQEILSAPVMPPAWAPYQRVSQPRHFPLSATQTQSLLQALAALTDPRRPQGQRHRHVASIVAIATAAMIAGNNSLIDIGEFAHHLNQTQLRSLQAYRNPKTRRYEAPSESTIRRVLQRLDPDPLDQMITTWLRSHLQEVGITSLAVDGKSLRTAAKINGHSLQLFSALDTQTRLHGGQLRIPAKTNEITSLPDLLKDLDLRGTLVTTDALNTQKKTATHLVEDKHADYLLVVKANQPKLFERLAQLACAPTGDFFPSGYRAGPGARPA